MWTGGTRPKGGAYTHHCVRTAHVWSVGVFGEIGAALGGLRLPTLVVQEGGYNADKTGEVRHRRIPCAD